METNKSNQPVYKRLYGKGYTFLENNPLNQWYAGAAITLTLALLIMGAGPALLGGLGLMAGYKIHALSN